MIDLSRCGITPLSLPYIKSTIVDDNRMTSKLDTCSEGRLFGNRKNQVFRVDKVLI